MLWWTECCNTICREFYREFPRIENRRELFSNSRICRKISRKFHVVNITNIVVAWTWTYKGKSVRDENRAWKIQNLQQDVRRKFYISNINIVVTSSGFKDIQEQISYREFKMCNKLCIKFITLENFKNKSSYRKLFKIQRNFLEFVF